LSKKKRLEPRGSRRLCLFVLPAYTPDAVLVTRTFLSQRSPLIDGVPHLRNGSELIETMQWLCQKFISLLQTPHLRASCQTGELAHVPIQN